MRRHCSSTDIEAVSSSLGALRGWSIKPAVESPCWFGEARGRRLHGAGPAQGPFTGFFPDIEPDRITKSGSGLGGDPDSVRMLPPPRELRIRSPVRNPDRTNQEVSGVEIWTGSGPTWAQIRAGSGPDLLGLD